MWEEAPNTPSKCKWSPRSTQPSPHHHTTKTPTKKVLDHVLEQIGNTPMVHLRRLKQLYNLKCNLLAKCEYFNPGGSVKDRIAYRMVQEARRENRLKPNCTLIEPTSGNTGIGIALAAAVFDYKCIIVLPEKMSQEKIDVLKGLGAEIVRTRTSANYYDEDSHIKIAQRLRDSIKDSVILDQYKNPYNPIAHYDSTAEDILYDCDGQLDCVVLTAGTGGTVSGVARKIKEKAPSCVVVAVDPVGSVLALPSSLNSECKSYEVEGIGYDFDPTVIDKSCIDEWVKVDDPEAFLVARQLIKSEGMLCGGSSGSCVHAAVQYILKNDHLNQENKNVVVLLPDSLRNYMTKFLSDSWMVANDFLPPNPIESGVNFAENWWGVPLKIIFDGPTLDTVSNGDRRKSFAKINFSNDSLREFSLVTPVVTDSYTFSGLSELTKMYDITLFPYSNEADHANDRVSGCFDGNRFISKLVTDRKFNTLIKKLERNHNTDDASYSREDEDAARGRLSMEPFVEVKFSRCHVDTDTLGKLYHVFMAGGGGGTNQVIVLDSKKTGRYVATVTKARFITFLMENFS